jgi:hypothetical protein
LKKVSNYLRYVGRVNVLLKFGARTCSKFEETGYAITVNTLTAHNEIIVYQYGMWT